MTTSLSKIVDTTLPAISGSKVSFNRNSNMFETERYTSAAGNSYYQGILLSDRIIINFDLGRGYAYLFLNGIRVYGYNGEDKHLLGTRSYYSQTFYKEHALRETSEIVMEYMKGQMKLKNLQCDDEQLKLFSKQIVESTYNQMKQIA